MLGAGVGVWVGGGASGKPPPVPQAGDLGPNHRAVPGPGLRYTVIPGRAGAGGWSAAAPLKYTLTGVCFPDQILCFIVQNLEKYKEKNKTTATPQSRAIFL